MPKRQRDRDNRSDASLPWRRGESNPLDAALQAVATPCDFSVIKSVSLPGVEPGLRPSQSRVRPPHSKDI